MTQTLAAVRAIRPYALAAFAVPLLVLLWAYWTALGEAADRWAHDPLYSHGYLVPAFAALLLWLRRGKLTAVELHPSWWGLAILAAAAALRLLGIFFHFEYLDPLSLHRNYELNVLVSDTGTGERMSELFETDIASATPVNLDEWRRRPWHYKAAEQIASLFGWNL